MNLKELQKSYLNKKELIQKRLQDFKEVWLRQDNSEIFKELCFCILTANASAKMGIRAMSALGDSVLYGELSEIAEKLKTNHRFYNTRAAYIFHTRENLKEKFNFDIIGLINSFNDNLSLRSFFAESKLIKGLGYKEASHFLRNIGFRGYAILDKHILNTMCELHILKEKPKTLTRKAYLEIENKLKNFADKINIDFDELDLLLWSEKTGEILK